MKHDRALRADAREIYDLNNIEPGSDWFRAERERDPAYFASVDEAVRRREAKWDWEQRARQLPLL